MIKVESFQNKYQNSVIKHIKKVLGSECGFEVNREKTPDLWSIDKIYKKSGGNFWVALSNDAVIGTMALKNIGNKRGLLKRLYIQKKYRGQGVASNLLNTLLTFAKKQNFETIYLGTAKKMITANKFYQKHNFEMIQKLPPGLPTHGNPIFYKLNIIK
jgi:ribosomal protein S18 acetylase RimI-like enzyme